MKAHKIALVAFTVMTLWAGTFSAMQAPAQDAVRPPNNSTPGTATANTNQTAAYKVDRHQITLRPKEGIEYKYEMKKGSTMVYSWKSSGKVNHEFHGEPEGAPRGYADTYLKEDGVEQSHGTFLAPSNGIHGWYWENTTDRDVVVTINAGGFFSRAFTLSRAGRVPRELPDADAGR